MKDNHLVDDETESTVLDADWDMDLYALANIEKPRDLAEEPDMEENLVPDMDLTPDSGTDRIADADKGAKADPDADEQDSEDDMNKTRMEIYDWLQCIVSAIICGIFIFVFVGRTIGVDGRSMMKTLHNNDRVIMSHLFYSPKNGDVVVFQTQSDSFGGTPLVKRVIAVAGQTIDIDFVSGDVFVDGILQVEPYINELTHNKIDFSGPLTVPEGHIFVMGDNRNSSSDSRDHRVGLVDTRFILGKVLFIAIPGADTQNPRDWSRIGVVH